MRSAIQFILPLVGAGCASGGGGDGDADTDVDTDVDTDADCPEPLVCDGVETTLDCHCRGDCRDTLTDPSNCGACFLNCRVEDGYASACVDGECVCGDSTALCKGTLSDSCCPDAAGAGACVDLLTDEANCGACGTACGPPLSSMCRSGQCVCGVPADPEITPDACNAPMVCCGEGTDATCQAAGSC